MTEKTGAASNMVQTNYKTFGSPIQGGVGSKLVADSESLKRNTTELTETPVGSGLLGKMNSDVGDDSPGGTITKSLRTDDAGNAAIACFMGDETVTTVGSGAYLHSFLLQAQSNVNYLAIAKEVDSANVHEWIDMVVNKLSIDLSPNQYAKLAYDVAGSLRRITGTTNTNGSMASATSPTNYNFATRDISRFWINLRGGAALQSSDLLAFTSAKVDLQKLQEFVAEARGAAGKGPPRLAGEPVFEGGFQITLKAQDGNAMFVAHDAGTDYKGSVLVEGPTIGGGFKHSVRIDFPCLRLVKEPDYNLGSAKVNPLSLTFDVLIPSAAPTGMNGVYPGIYLQNDRATRYLSAV